MERIDKILGALRDSRTGTLATPSRRPTRPSSPPLPPLTQIAHQLNVNPGHTLAALADVPGLREALAATQGVLAGERPMALIYGGVGNGKTHLLEGAVIELYQRGGFCRLVDYANLLSALRRAIGNQETPGLYQIILDRYCAASRLVLDDIGAGGSDTDFGDRVLEAVVCARYGRRLLTLMATNRDIATLPERVLSRLQDKSMCYLVCNKAPDYRPHLIGK